MVLPSIGKTPAVSISGVHKAAVEAGVFTDPTGTSGLATAQKGVLREFLGNDARVGRTDVEGARGPEAAKWFKISAGDAERPAHSGSRRKR